MNGTNLLAVPDVAAAAAAVMNGPELRLTPAAPKKNGSPHTRENREEGTMWGGMTGRDMERDGEKETERYRDRDGEKETGDIEG